MNTFSSLLRVSSAAAVAAESVRLLIFAGFRMEKSPTNMMDLVLSLIKLFQNRILNQKTSVILGDLERLQKCNQTLFSILYTYFSSNSNYCVNVLKKKSTFFSTLYFLVFSNLDLRRAAWFNVFLCKKKKKPSHPSISTLKSHRAARHHRFISTGLADPRRPFKWEPDGDSSPPTPPPLTPARPRCSYALLFDALLSCVSHTYFIKDPARGSWWQWGH